MSPAQMADLNRANHPAGLGWTETGITTLLKDPNVTAITREAGFALIRCAAGEAELLTIDVAQDAQGKGIGRSILAEALQYVAETGAETMFLEVAADNVAALALYRSAGFIEIGRRPRYYRRPQGQTCDALMLRRDLVPTSSSPAGPA